MQNPQSNMIGAIVVVLPQNNHSQPTANHNPQQLQPTTKPITSSTHNSIFILLRYLDPFKFDLALPSIEEYLKK
jgi:hypothetical protein